MDAAGPATEDLYTVLGVEPDASDETIRHAYHRLARQVHPDTGATFDQGFKRLAAAYEVLGDQRRRRAYDRDRVRPAPAATPLGPVAARRAPGPTGIVPPSRPTVVRMAAQAPPAPPTTSAADEWRTLGRVLRWVVIAGTVAAIALVLVIMLTADSRRSMDTGPAPFCKTPDGWVDCRVLDPFSS